MGRLDPRRWALWSLPGGVLAYVVAVQVVACAILLATAVATPISARSWTWLGVLVIASVVHLETAQGVERIREPAAEATPYTHLQSVIAAAIGLGYAVTLVMVHQPWTAPLLLVTILALHLGLLLPQFRAAARTDGKTGLVTAQWWHDQAAAELKYTNHDNWRAHHNSTAPAIERRFPKLDALFVGAGTTGTLMGCAGLGASVRPQLLDESCVDDVVHVSEGDTVRARRRPAKAGFLFGGSTGTVLSGALSWLEQHEPANERTSVAIAPDLGERYLDTVHDDMWTEENIKGKKHGCDAEVRGRPRSTGERGADGQRA